MNLFGKSGQNSPRFWRPGTIMMWKSPCSDCKRQIVSRAKADGRNCPQSCRLPRSRESDQNWIAPSEKYPCWFNNNEKRISWTSVVNGQHILKFESQSVMTSNLSYLGFFLIYSVAVWINQVRSLDWWGIYSGNAFVLEFELLSLLAVSCSGERESRRYSWHIYTKRDPGFITISWSLNFMSILLSVWDFWMRRSNPSDLSTVSLLFPNSLGVPIDLSLFARLHFLSLHSQ
jgi:hypothetical protein